MIDQSVQEFRRQAGIWAPAMEHQGKIQDYRAELDRVARIAYEAGLTARPDRRLHAIPPPKGAA
jgi:hypothetical protein